MIRFAGMFDPGHAQVDPRDLDKMIHPMKSAGKEEPRFLVLGEAGFACISIGDSIRKENKGSPYVHPNWQWMTVLDGRIDNRQELLERLRPQLSGHGVCIPDEMIVLGAYEIWGLDFASHLIGDFAVVIWDRSEQRLVCVRDRFGVKPLYYCQYQDGLLFASTPIAILVSGRVAPCIQEGRIADHLVNPLEGVDKTSSFYKDIYRLPPAHMLVVQPGGVNLKRYWELSPAVDEKLKTEEEYIDVFQEVWMEAVRCRLQDGTGTAVMLSGGMDSSSIVGMSREIRHAEGSNALDVFAAISNVPGTNRETACIRSVLSLEQLSPHLVSESELRDCMDKLVYSIETEAEPFDCLMNLNRSIYLHARNLNFEAVLDGIDGDVLLTGSGHLIQLWKRGAFKTILSETVRADGLTAEYRQGRGLLIHSLLSVMIPLAPEWYRNIRRPFRYHQALSKALRETIIERDFAVCSRLGERFTKLYSHSPRPVVPNQIDFHKIALNHPFLTVGMERYERVASAFGIEARHPFADVRLVEFCLGLPWQLKTQRGWTKYILRRAMEPYLPPEVVWRRDKDSLMWEVNRLILKERAEYFYQATLDERESLKPYVDIRKLESIWREYLTKGDEKNAVSIWSGIALAFWLRRHRNMVRDLRLAQ